MKNLRHKLFAVLRGVLRASLLLFLVMGVASVAFKLLANTDPNYLYQSHSQAVANKRGLVYAYDKRHCGCPDKSAYSQQDWDNVIRKQYHLWPTRCRAQNLEPQTPQNYNPKDNWGRPYPIIYYPDRYPDRWRYNNRRTIPFPGWPLKRYQGAVKDRWTPWRDTHRKNYKHVYWKVEGGKLPQYTGSQPNIVQGFPVRSWSNQRTYWEIHHILERTYGGTNHPMNLVPVYARSNKSNANGEMSNLHHEYTKWWDNIDVDSDCNTTARKKPIRVKNSNGQWITTTVWDQIKGCRAQATVWPPVN